jgi:hypothetical protein
MLRILLQALKVPYQDISFLQLFNYAENYWVTPRILGGKMNTIGESGILPKEIISLWDLKRRGTFPSLRVFHSSRYDDIFFRTPGQVKETSRKHINLMN